MKVRIFGNEIRCDQCGAYLTVITSANGEPLISHRKQDVLDITGEWYCDNWGKLGRVPAVELEEISE